MGPTSLASRAGHEHHALVTGWFEAYHLPLLRYLLRLTGDEDRAAELLQETFLRAFDSLASQPAPDNPSAWLYRIATHLAYDLLRRRRRLRWLPLSGQETMPAFESDVATAESVRRCLARLRPIDAELLLLYEYAGLSCVEIAALTGVEAATLRVRLHRARLQFRRLYDED